MTFQHSLLLPFIGDLALEMRQNNCDKVLLIPVLFIVYIKKDSRCIPGMCAEND